MKHFSAIIAALGIMTMINVASAWEFAPAQNCVPSNPDTYAEVYYSWVSANANGNGAYVICPVTRTYSYVSEAKAYVYNSSGTVSGYLNWVGIDGSTHWSSGSTTNTGVTTVSFPGPSNIPAIDGFVNIEVNLSPWANLYGVFTN